MLSVSGRSGSCHSRTRSRRRMHNKSAREKKLLGEYTALATTYDRRWSAYLDASLTMTTGFLAELPATRILDIACGTGLLLKIMSERPDSPQLVGIDRVPAMLDEARRRLGSDATLLDADAGNLPFEDASFDLVTCTSALHYFLDSDAMFRELRRVTAPSGNVIITDWSRDFFWMKVLNRLLPLTRHAHSHTFTSGELEQRLDKAGFHVVRKVNKKIDWFWGLMTVHASHRNEP